MSLCPNKNLQEWKDLVEKYGHSRAHQAFFRKGDGGIPTIDEASKLLNIEPDAPTKGQQEWRDYVDNIDVNKKTAFQQINEKVKGRFDGFKETAKRAVQTIFPQAFEKGFYATMSKIILREKFGESYIKNWKADKESESVMKEWDSNYSHKERLAFLDAMENPDAISLEKEPRLKQLSELYRDRLDAVYKTIAGIKDLPYIEDYFPHFWKNPEKAKTFFSSISAKNPLQGNRSFFKKRFFEDIRAGLDAGLELATDNPEEIVRLSEMNATKFKMANDIFDSYKESGMLTFVRGKEKPPEGWKLVDDALFKRMTPFVVEGEEGPQAAVSMGGWYMPEDASRIVNNYLSRGLKDMKGVRHVYEGLMYWNNIKNMFQLALSPFHIFTTSINAGLTDMSMGVQNITTGKTKNIAQGIRQIAEGALIIPSVMRNFAKATAIRKDAYSGNASVEVQRLVEANGRIDSDKMWITNAGYQLNKNIQKIKADGLLGAPIEVPIAVWNGLMSTVEATMMPTVKFVSAMKVGAHARSVENELSLRGPLSDVEIKDVAQRHWDNMDDRFGQVVYDNMFWQKTIKDIAFMTVRSFGYTGGTLRAYRKGVTEIPESLGRLKEGQGLSSSSAWLLMLPVQAAMYGAVYHYIATGKAPEEFNDYFHPKDGTKNLDGSDRRVDLWGYYKDANNWIHNPFKTLINKTSPAVNEISEIYNNKDFYGASLYQEDDNLFQKGIDVLKYQFGTLQPFGFREKPGEEVGKTTQQKIESFIGVQPSSSKYQRTDDENVVQELLSDQMKNMRKSADYSPEKSAYKKIIIEQLREKQALDQIPKEEKIKAGIMDSQGNIVPKALKSIMGASHLSNIDRSFKYLDAKNQLKAISKMTPEGAAETLSNRKVVKKVREFIDLKRGAPEFFEKNPELKKAYELITKKKFDETDERDQAQQETESNP